MLHRIDDETAVLIRPIRPTDKRALQRGLGALSDASAHARFLAPKDHFTAAELSYLTEVDGADHAAFVAMEPGAGGRLLAVARYVRDPEHPDAAEAAITVADDLQGRGLGRRMGHVLADAARAHGIRRFTGSMLADNAAALALFASISERLTSEPLDGPVREIVAELAA